MRARRAGKRRHDTCHMCTWAIPAIQGEARSKEQSMQLIQRQRRGVLAYGERGLAKPAWWHMLVHIRPGLAWRHGHACMPMMGMAAAAPCMRTLTTTLTSEPLKPSVIRPSSWNCSSAAGPRGAGRRVSGQAPTGDKPRAAGLAAHPGVQCALRPLHALPLTPRQPGSCCCHGVCWLRCIPSFATQAGGRRQEGGHDGVTVGRPHPPAPHPPRPLTLAPPPLTCDGVRRVSQVDREHARARVVLGQRDVDALVKASACTRACVDAGLSSRHATPRGLKAPYHPTCPPVPERAATCPSLPSARSSPWAMPSAPSPAL